jgi:hypothetical protein
MEPRPPEREPEPEKDTDICHGTGHVNGDPEQGSCPGCDWCQEPEAREPEPEKDEPWRYSD